jgi:hypothetical protein
MSAPANTASNPTVNVASRSPVRYRNRFNVLAEAHPQLAGLLQHPFPVGCAVTPTRTDASGSWRTSSPGSGRGPDVLRYSVSYRSTPAKQPQSLQQQRPTSGVYLESSGHRRILRFSHRYPRICGGRPPNTLPRRALWHPATPHPEASLEYEEPREGRRRGGLTYPPTPHPVSLAAGERVLCLHGRRSRSAQRRSRASELNGSGTPRRTASLRRL